MIRTVMKKKILQFLNKLGISYEALPHAPITTMEEGKAIIDKYVQPFTHIYQLKSIPPTGIICPNFPHGGEQPPLMWGFIPHDVEEIRGNAYR